MRFTPTELPGVAVVELEPHTDERGWFARVWCAEEFAAAGLDPRAAQLNLSATTRRGTVRGLHWQSPPHGEAKLVRCVRGAIYDVAADVGARRCVGVELTQDNGRALFIPAGLAHGHQALTDDALVLYVMSTPYVPGASRGARPDDPALAIPWPLPPTNLSAADRTWPLLRE